MKYKVILYNNLGSPEVDTSGTFTFFRREDAERCVSSWRAISSAYYAYLWDGEQWVYYTPIP